MSGDLGRSDVETIRDGSRAGLGDFGLEMGELTRVKRGGSPLPIFMEEYPVCVTCDGEGGTGEGEGEWFELVLETKELGRLEPIELTGDTPMALLLRTVRGGSNRAPI